MITASPAPSSAGAPAIAMPDGLSLPKLPLPGPGDAGMRHLPAPPAPGSLASKAELAIMHAVQDHRTSEGDAWAQKFNRHLGLDTWKAALSRLGEREGNITEARAAALLGVALVATAAVTSSEKHHFDRARPFKLDPSITTVIKPPKDSSYPSGHSSTGFAAARILSNVDPSHTAEYYDLATQEAMSRVYAGVHFPSDVVAGALLGTAVAETVLRKLDCR